MVQWWKKGPWWSFSWDPKTWGREGPRLHSWPFCWLIKWGLPSYKNIHETSPASKPQQTREKKKQWRIHRFKYVFPIEHGVLGCWFSGLKIPRFLRFTEQAAEPNLKAWLVSGSRASVLTQALSNLTILPAEGPVGAEVGRGARGNKKCCCDLFSGRNISQDLTIHMVNGVSL